MNNLEAVVKDFDDVSMRDIAIDNNDVQWQVLRKYATLPELLDEWELVENAEKFKCSKEYENYNGYVVCRMVDDPRDIRAFPYSTRDDDPKSVRVYWTLDI
jgi:hypothetical protein